MEPTCYAMNEFQAWNNRFWFEVWQKLVCELQPLIVARNSKLHVPLKEQAKYPTAAELDKSPHNTVMVCICHAAYRWLSYANGKLSTNFLSSTYFSIFINYSANSLHTDRSALIKKIYGLYFIIICIYVFIELVEARSGPMHARGNGVRRPQYMDESEPSYGRAHDLLTCFWYLLLTFAWKAAEHASYVRKHQPLT